MPRTEVALFLLVLGAAAARAQDTAPVDSLALARQYTQWLYYGEADSLLAHSSEWALERYATREEWGRRSDMIAERLGFETNIIEEAWRLVNGRCEYWRTSQFSGLAVPFMIRWMLNEHWEIVGLQLSAPSAAPEAEAESCGG